MGSFFSSPSPCPQEERDARGSGSTGSLGDKESPKLEFSPATSTSPNCEAVSLRTEVQSSERGRLEHPASSRTGCFELRRGADGSSPLTSLAEDESRHRSHVRVLRGLGVDGALENEFPELLGYDAYRLVGDAGRNEQGEATVDVVVSGSRGASSFEETFTFCLVEREFGRKKGC